jgi:hypothetical protein
MNPEKRLTPDDALKHPWLKRNDNKSMLKENEMIVESIMKDMNLANITRANSCNRQSSTLKLKSTNIKKEDLRPSEVNESSTARNKPNTLVKRR